MSLGVSVCTSDVSGQVKPTGSLPLRGVTGEALELSSPADVPGGMQDGITHAVLVSHSSLGA